MQTKNKQTLLWHHWIQCQVSPLKKKKNEKKSGRDKHMLSHWCCQSIQNPSKCEFTSAFWSYFFRPSLSWEIHNNRWASSEGLFIFFFSGHL